MAISKTEALKRIGALLENIRNQGILSNYHDKDLIELEKEVNESYGRSVDNVMATKLWHRQYKKSA